MSKVFLIVFLIVNQNIAGQSIMSEDQDDLFTRTLQYYLDSTINRNHIYDKFFETLPLEQRFTNFLLVGSNKIISKIPDRIQFVNWIKMNEDDFCKLIKPNKKWDWILFIKSDSLTDSTTSVTILKYYSQNVDCDIEFQNSEKFLYHFDKFTNRYILNNVDYETYVIIM